MTTSDSTVEDLKNPTERKIVIAGDSWGHSAQTVKQYKRMPDSSKELHLMMSSFFKDTNIPVIQLTHPGGCNEEAISKLERTIPLIKKPYIFWVQSDPVRDLDVQANWRVLLAWFNNQADVIKSIGIFATKAYERLNKLAAEHNTTIYCLGGCSMLYESIHNYPNLKPIMPSIINFLRPDFTQDSIIYNSHWISDLVRIQSEKRHLVNKSNLEVVVDKWYPKDNFFRSMGKYFSTDGVHPDPDGVKLWTDECKKYII